MRCPKCEFENREDAKFCKKCGAKLDLKCPACGHGYLPDSLFCDECGQRLTDTPEEKKPPPEAEGERKYVTVLFSDLSGYTAMSERLDPEEVKEITSRIFEEISEVVANYEGFIEKFVGDAVMALFGVPKAHEDDPVRAIRAAREIHDLVEARSPELHRRIGRPLSMHTGINTGLVVTGKVDLEKGTHGVAGDTINIASRLSGLAKAAEIVVGPETYRQAEGHFTFESLEPTKFKGKSEPIPVYQVLSSKEEPSKVHRLRGLRADLIGRKVEMAQLGEAVHRLREGKGKILSICGDAGTGKSRLVEEFKATLDFKEIQWLEGHAYAYSQNIPYFPLINLLNRIWRIEEGDSPEEIRNRIESRMEDLIGKREDIVPYVGSLYSLSYPEIEGVSPEFWKSRLQEAIQAILSGLTQRGPTIICLEDLHWADPSSIELLRTILTESRSPALFLCVYRPPFSLFTSHELGGLGKLYQEIRLQDLSPSEAQGMVESLLRTDSIPPELGQLIKERVEGNPFYLEEVINALIEAGTLARENGTWKLERPISESDIPSTIQGVISARLDRLERETKRVLQEASVIGRAFLHEILKRITEIREQVDRCLSGLERYDLIRTRAIEPELEYVFKHALTQEVVYNGLLKKERQEIHERIANVLEELFQERLPEFYETLAFHFSRGQSLHKAVDYLVKSGEKSFRRYALEESHQYFRDAFDLVSNKTAKTREEERLVIDILNSWGMVFHLRGDFRGMEELLKRHKSLAESSGDKSTLGQFYAWLGHASVMNRLKLKDAYQYLSMALKLGEEVDNKRVVGWACAYLQSICFMLGLQDQSIHFMKQAKEISGLLESDHYLYFHTMTNIGFVHWMRGERQKTLDTGKALLEFGQRESNVRCLAMGNLTIGHSYLLAGDFSSASQFYERSLQVSADPFHSKVAEAMLGYCHVLSGQPLEADNLLQGILCFSDEFGFELFGKAGYVLLGVVMIAKGQMSRGLRMIEEARQYFVENETRYHVALSEYSLGKVYFQIVEGVGPIRIPTMAKNIGFLIKNVPFASKKAEDHFNKAINVSKEIGARGILGQAYLDLGLLQKTREKKDKARECISEAAKLFEECEAEVYLKQAKEAMASLDEDSK